VSAIVIAAVLLTTSAAATPAASAPRYEPPRFELSLAAGPALGVGAFPQDQFRAGVYLGLDTTPGWRNRLYVGLAYDYGYFVYGGASWLSTAILIQAKLDLKPSMRLPLAIGPILGGGVWVLGSPSCTLEQCQAFEPLQLLYFVLRMGGRIVFVVASRWKLFLEPSLDLVAADWGEGWPKIVNLAAGFGLDF